MGLDGTRARLWLCGADFQLSGRRVVGHRDSEARSAALDIPGRCDAEPDCAGRVVSVDDGLDLAGAGTAGTGRMHRTFAAGGPGDWPETRGLAGAAAEFVDQSGAADGADRFDERLDCPLARGGLRFGQGHKARGIVNGDGTKRNYPNPAAEGVRSEANADAQQFRLATVVAQPRPI